MPIFRQDLEIITFVGAAGRFRYLIKVPDSADVFELGEEEYFLCQQLDGQSPLTAIQSAFQRQFGIPIQLFQLEALVRHLDSLGLLVRDTRAPEIALPIKPPAQPWRLGNPDRFLSFLATWCSWCFSTPFLIAFFLVFGAALLIAIQSFSIFHRESKFIWKAGPFFLETFLGLFVVNVLGELGKATAAKRYGAQVPECGFYLVYKILPHFYCEIGDSIWVTNRSQRMHIFSAGLICQLWLWAICVFCWKNTYVGTAHTFWMIFCTASAFFTLINAIPLLPRDGYNLLVNWFEVQDLIHRARSLCRAWFWRNPLPEPLSSRAIRWFKWFGILSIGYETLVLGLIVVLFSYLMVYGWQLKGLGAVTILAVVVLQMEHFLKGQTMRIPFLRKMFINESGRIKTRRVVKLGLLVVVIIIMLIPYPFEAGGEFKLSPISQLAVRAQVPGEIERVIVKEGQWVQKGDPLATFLGKDQKAKVEELTNSLVAAQEKLDLLKSGPKAEAVAKAEQDIKLAAKTLQFSAIEANRYAKMFKEKAVSEKEYQDVLKIRDEDREKLEVARKNLEVVKNPFRSQEIKAQEAEVRRVEAELALAKKDLELCTLVSPCEGRVITAFPSQAVRQYLEVGNLFGVVEDSRTYIAEIEVPEEDIEEVKIGARVKLKSWAYPSKTFKGKVLAIAPATYEKSRHRIERLLSEKEWNFTQKELINPEGKVVRVISEFSNPDGLLKTDMTGYAKIQGSWKPVGIAFTRWLVRFFLVEVWSWIP